ncbi:MAG: PBP1A family penicillin-binding protein [Caldilineales bacterium]|nr:PBP1A family penicillin-binding protein [Caldilineales bacterium]
MSRSRNATFINILLIGFLLLVAVAAFAASAALYGYSRIAETLPPPQELQDRANTFKTTTIYDRDGRLLYEVFPQDGGRRTVVSLGEISPYLINATLATEDPNFYRHPGVDPVGLARAAYYVVQNDERRPGGSGIPQQLVKLTFLSTEKTLSRKIKEAILALEVSRRYRKDDILEIYLNHIPYGNLAFGAEAAAQTYFGKPASTLTLGEASLLAGIPQAPGYYDPYTNWEAVRGRQGDILRLMVQYGLISPSEADAAWLEFAGKDVNEILMPADGSFTAPHFVLMVRQQLETEYGADVVAKGGLRVTTTLDRRLQSMAEQAVDEGMINLRERGAGSAALTAIDPNTGEILAMVGSADYDDEASDGQVNMAVEPRQTGSVIKPLTYAAAFEKMPDYWTPATMIMDERTEFGDGPGRPPYVPKNYDGRFHGPVSARAALANSYNIPAVKALEHIGIPALKEMATRLGISTFTRPDYGLSLTLGGSEASLVEMSGAFASFANGGYRVRPHAIMHVETEEGDLLESHQRPQLLRALAPEIAYLITSILSDAEARRPAFGNAGRSLILGERPVAAKTGTTDDWRDAWTIGYTPQLVTGVWVGNADNSPMNKDTSGVIAAAPIWQRFMRQAHQDLPIQPFPKPEGVVRMEICADTGTQADADCTNRRQEFFKFDQLPSGSASTNQLFPTTEPL